MANSTNLTTVMNYPAENLVLAPRGRVDGYNNISGGYPAKIVGHYFNVKHDDATHVFRGVVSKTAAQMASGTASNIVTSAVANNIVYNKTDQTEYVFDGSSWNAQNKINGFLSILTSYIIIKGFVDQNYSFGEDTDWNPARYLTGDKIYIYTDPDDENSVHEKTIASTQTVDISTANQVVVIELDTNITYKTGSEVFNPFSFLYKFNMNSLNNYYVASTDTSVNSGKIYYTKSGSSYTKVASPSGNPSTKGYYELKCRKCLGEIDLTSNGDVTYQLLLAIYTSCDISIEVYRDGERLYGGYITTYDEPTNKLQLLFGTAASPVSQEPYFYSRYEVRINYDSMQSSAIIENKDFDYTTNTSGEYNTNTGCNAVASGNGNTITGDFSTVNGLYNGVASQESDVAGVNNRVSNCTGAFVRGINNKARNSRDVYVFGGSNELNAADGTMQVGGLNKATGMNNLQIGNSNNAIGRSTVAIGALNKNLADRTVTVGYNLTNNAFGSTLIGANGNLPLYKVVVGTNIDVTQAYAAGSGIWYRDAVAIAAGLGQSSSDHKEEVPIIFSKYRYIKNVAYPYGPANTKPAANSGVTGADGSKTNGELRDSTTEDPVVLSRYNQLSVDASLVVNGISFNDDSYEVDNASGSIQLDRLVSAHYVVTPSAALTINPVILNMRNYDEITLIIKNGGTNVTMPTSWKNGGDAFTLTSVGYDVFTIKKFILGGTEYYVYRHEYQFN